MSSAAIQRSVYGFYIVRKGHDSEILRRHLAIAKSIVSVFTIVLLYRKILLFMPSCEHVRNPLLLIMCGGGSYKMRQRWLGRTPTLI